MNLDLELAKERILLDAQRTVSAWIRTGLAGIGGGFAIFKLISFKVLWHEIVASIIGQVLIIWGALICIFAFYDYHKLIRRLKARDMLPAIPYQVFFICLIACCCGLFLFLITFKF